MFLNLDEYRIKIKLTHFHAFKYSQIKMTKTQYSATAEYAIYNTEMKQT